MMCLSPSANSVLTLNEYIGNSDLHYPYTLSQVTHTIIISLSLLLFGCLFLYIAFYTTGFLMRASFAPIA